MRVSVARITGHIVPDGPAARIKGHDHVLRALEIDTDERMIWAMTCGQLEAKVATGERLKAAASLEVSQELKAERLAEADARVRAAELSALGDRQAARAAVSSRLR